MHSDKAGILLTTADGVNYKTETENVFENFYWNKDLFYFSIYSKGPNY